jgi:predicted O-methyltransferase YrrM
MNWRRVVLFVLGGTGAALLLLGAFARDPVWMALGAVGAFAGVAMASLMLSRQIAWLAGEVGNARGFIVDKVLTLGAQLKAQNGLLATQQAETSRLRSLLVKHADAARTEQQTRFEHLEAVANELFASGKREVVADAELARREVAALISSMDSIREGFVGTVTAVTSAQAEYVSHLQRLEKALSDSRGEGGILVEKADLLLRLQEGIRSEVTDGANLAMRVYRELTDSIDESSRSAVRKEDMLAGLNDIKSAFAKGEAKSQSMLDELAEIRRIASTQEGVRSALDALVKVTSAIEDLRAFLLEMHDADKEGLKSFVNDEKKLRKVSQLSMQWLKTEILHEIEALSQLRPLLHVEGATPLLGGWAMDAAAIHSLVAIIREKRPLRIVELGSGSSTVWLALALRSIGRGRVVSFEHLDIYGQRTWQAIKEQGLEAFAEVRVRKLVEIELDGKRFDWYDLGDAEVLDPIDLLLVDGPPGGTGPMARFPAIPVLWSQLAGDALIVVDDASRPDEKHMLASWRDAFPELGEPESIGARTLLLRRQSDARVRARD